MLRFLFASALFAMPVTASAYVAADGTTLTCMVGGRHIPDRFSVDPGFIQTGFAGYATLDPQYGPVILLNQYQMSLLPVPAQKFTFWHECAHHEDPMDATDQKEIRASCRAMTRIRANGLLNAGAEAVLANYVRSLPARPPLYPPGPQQWYLMNQCGTPPVP